MVGRWMMFCRIVGHVTLSWFPMDNKLFTGDTIFQPIKSHIDGFGAFLFNRASEDTLSGDVIGREWRWWLRMAHLDKALSDWQDGLSVYVQGTNFGFGGRSHDVLDDFCEDQKGTIEELLTVFVAEEILSTHPAMGFRADEVCCVETRKLLIYKS